MINSIHLKNFQAHKDTEIELHPKINVITGETDQGKTSIVRALYWLCFNRPSGNEFIRNGTKSCTVTINADGSDVSRTKSLKSINKYVIDGKEFSALRTDVPEEVSEILQITPTNIQFQDDPPFLLSLNSSDVAKMLNQVIGLDEIDSSLKYVNGIIRSQHGKEKYVKEELKKKEKEKSKYDSLNSIKELYKEYEQEQERLTELDERLVNLERSIDVLNEMLFVLNRQTQINNLAESVSELQEERKKIEDDKRVVEKISALILSISETEKRINKQNKEQKNIVAILNEIDEAEKKKKKLNEKKKQATSIYKKLTTAAKSWNTIEKSLDKAKAAFEEIKERLGYCPTCGQQLAVSRRKK